MRGICHVLRPLRQMCWISQSVIITVYWQNSFCWTTVVVVRCSTHLYNCNDVTIEFAPSRPVQYLSYVRHWLRPTYSTVVLLDVFLLSMITVIHVMFVSVVITTGPELVVPRPFIRPLQCARTNCIIPLHDHRGTLFFNIDGSTTATAG